MTRQSNRSNIHNWGSDTESDGVLNFLILIDISGAVVHLHPTSGVKVVTEVST